jgi:hypothetical protein
MGLNEILGLYNNGRSNAELLLSGHAGDHFSVDRAGRGHISLNSPRLSMGTLSQPDFLAKLLGNAEMLDRGLLNRWLYFVTPTADVAQTLAENPVPSAVKENYHRLIWLLTEKKPPRPANLSEDVPGMGKLKLSRAAFERELRPYAREINKEIRRAEQGETSRYSENMLGWAQKLRGAAARLAGVFHMVENIDHAAPWELEISADTVRRAVALCRALESHAVWTFARGWDSEKPGLTLEGKALDWLRRTGKHEVKPHELAQFCKPAIKDTAAGRVVLIKLENKGYVRRMPTGDVWQVNPGLWKAVAA